MGADYTFYVKTIETHARAFLTLNILAIGRVEIFTIAAIKAETDPPPGADDRAATSWTNSLTEHEIKGPSELGKQYSIIRSLKNG